MMDRYKILKELGDGTCGSVYKAINIETSEIVAVKKMKRKFYDWNECVNLREVKSLRKLNHPNIIKLKEIVQENNELFFIFEYMEHNLYQTMRERQGPFSEEEIRRMMSQLLQGLTYMHSNGYFHRDLKPENLLVTRDIIKIADFGLVREVSSLPPFTDYVSTRWYRAPEVLLQSSSYSPAIDMWAVGCILAELLTSYPIFPGESEMDQLYKICCILGQPDWTSFPEARNISRLVDISYFEIMPANLSDVVPNASPEAIDLIKQLCTWDPTKRLTADQCLQHSFFQVGYWISHSPVDPLQLTLSCIGSKPNLELNLWDFGSREDDCYLGLSLAVKPSGPDIDACLLNVESALFISVFSTHAHMFSAEMVHKNKGQQKDMLFCSGFQDGSKRSVFWSLFPPDDDGMSAPVESSLSLSFSAIPNPSSGGPQSTGFAFGSLQSNMLDHRPLLALSSPLEQQSHWL